MVITVKARLNMSMNVQSVITTSDVAPKLNSKGKASHANSTQTITAAQACEAAYEYGSSVAGLDGTLTKALQAFKDNETVQADMLAALNVGYMVRKLGYTRDRATEVVGLLKYNEKKQDDHHRTFEQQRVMDTVRVIWHRAQKMAGIVKAKTDNQVKAEQTRAQKDAERAAHEQRLIKADELVNPKNDTDPFDALSRLVLTMKSLQSKYADKLVGDRGSAWRDWLANSPK
jgi:hypothetical protein